MRSVISGALEQTECLREALRRAPQGQGQPRWPLLAQDRGCDFAAVSQFKMQSNPSAPVRSDLYWKIKQSLSSAMYLFVYIAGEFGERKKQYAYWTQPNPSGTLRLGQV